MKQMASKVKETDNENMVSRQIISVFNDTKATILLYILVQNVQWMQFDYINML